LDSFSRKGREREKKKEKSPSKEKRKKNKKGDMMGLLFNSFPAMRKRVVVFSIFSALLEWRKNKWRIAAS